MWSALSIAPGSHGAGSLSELLGFLNFALIIEALR